MLPRMPGATTPGKRLFVIKNGQGPFLNLTNFNLHPFYPGKRLIFTDMDMEDESLKPEPSRDFKDAQPSSDSDDSDSEFAVKPQCLAARLAFDVFSGDDF